MSVNLRNLPKPECFSHIPDDEYHDRFAPRQLEQLERFAKSGSQSSEWGSAVLTAIAAPTPTQTIALPLETIEVLIQIADDSIWGRDRLGNASDREKTLLGEVAYAYMRKTGIWPDLKSVNPPKEIADIPAD